MAFLEIDAMPLVFHPLPWVRFWFLMSRLKITLSWPPISQSCGTISADSSNLPLLFPEQLELQWITFAKQLAAECQR
jgi:hypothetical protein